MATCSGVGEVNQWWWCYLIATCTGVSEVNQCWCGCVTEGRWGSVCCALVT